MIDTHSRQDIRNAAVRTLILLSLIALATGAAQACGGPPGRGISKFDSYLAHLRKEGRRDVPWYRLLPDGRYRLVTRNRRLQRVYSRAALMRKLGFTC